MKINKIMFIILTSIFVVISCISYHETKNITDYRTKDSLSISKCSNYSNVVNKYEDLCNCDTFDFEELDPDGVDYEDWKDTKTKYSSLSLKDCCYAYKNNIPLSPDYYTIFYQLIFNSRIMEFYHVYIIGLVVFFSLYGLNKLFRSKYLFYYVQREKYSKFMIKNILKSYGYVFSIVIFFIILYILSLTMSTHLDRTFSQAGAATFNEIYYGNKYFLLFYCIQTCLMCMTFINVGLVFLKNNKIIFTLIGTYIVYFITLLIMEKYNFVPLNILYSGRVTNIYMAVIWGLIYFGISLIPVIIAYRNKEDVLLKLDRSK